MVGRTLVERKLAACVNIYPPMTSVYVWQSKQEESQEVAAFIKTRRSLVDIRGRGGPPAASLHDALLPGVADRRRHRRLPRLGAQPDRAQPDRLEADEPKRAATTRCTFGLDAMVVCAPSMAITSTFGAGSGMQERQIDDAVLRIDDSRQRHRRRLGDAGDRHRVHRRPAPAMRTSPAAPAASPPASLIGLAMVITWSTHSGRRLAIRAQSCRRD